MTNYSNEIETINKYFEQYCSYKSEIMFNYNTDCFFDKLMSMTFVKEVIDDLIEKHKIEEHIFEERQCIEWFSFYKEIINQGYDYYLAYCLQFYFFLRKQNNPFQEYFDEIIWVDKSSSENGDRSTLFKTDFVRPILDYIINAYNAERHIVHLIKRYGERVERFKELVGEKDERTIQKNFAKYLFDSGCNFYREANTNNGQIDFCIPSDDESMRSSWECNEGQYIVEIKFFKDASQIQKGLSQLLAYLNQYHTHGCLLIFTDRELSFDNIPRGLEVITAYTGGKTPSKRGKAINIDLVQANNSESN